MPVTFPLPIEHSSLSLKPTYARLGLWPLKQTWRCKKLSSDPWLHWSTRTSMILALGLPSLKNHPIKTQTRLYFSFGKDRSSLIHHSATIWLPHHRGMSEKLASFILHLINISTWDYTAKLFIYFAGVEFYICISWTEIKNILF